MADIYRPVRLDFNLRTNDSVIGFHKVTKELSAKDARYQSNLYYVWMSMGQLSYAIGHGVRRSDYRLSLVPALK